MSADIAALNQSGRASGAILLALLADDLCVSIRYDCRPVRLPRDKLRAAINRASTDPDQDIDPGYVDACRRWFDGLSDVGKTLAMAARDAFDHGHGSEAERIAAGLPAAPKFPLLDSAVHKPPIEMTTASADKMHACLNQSWAEFDYLAQKDYYDACIAWWDSLSPEQQAIGLAVMEGYSVEHPERAEKLAASLPAAPKFTWGGAAV